MKKNGNDQADPKDVAEIKKLNIQMIRLKVVGDTPLLCFRFSEGAQEKIIDKQTGKSATGREDRDFAQEYKDALYDLPGGGYGFPASAFKCAAVEAVTSLKRKMSKVAVKQSLHVVGGLVELEGKPRPRQDMGRLNGKTAYPIIRPEFPEWSCVLTIRYNASAISHHEIVGLLDLAGFSVGVGAWRPEKKGTFGTFHVEAAN